MYRTLLTVQYVHQKQQSNQNHLPLIVNKVENYQVCVSSPAGDIYLTSFIMADLSPRKSFHVPVKKKIKLMFPSFF